MKLRLAAPPVDGKGNAALRAFIADFCGAPSAAVTLVCGEGARSKRVRIVDPTAEALVRLRQLSYDI